MKTCVRCGVTKPLDEFRPSSRNRDGYRGECRACGKAYQQAYYLANREKTLARHRKRREDNPELARAIARAWHKKNPERSAANRAAWLANNLDRRAGYTAAWRARNPDQNRDVIARRRARVQGTKVGRIDLAALWTGSCGICGQVLDESLRHPHPFSKSIDHIRPLALGGTHEQHNLQWAHLRCNLSKGARLIGEVV